MHHQDWEPVILRKPVTIVNKPKGPKPPQDGDEFNIPKITTEFKKAFTQARMLKKISQKDLAKALNVPLQDIVKYENGKAIPKNQFISKIEKFLGVKLPRCKKQKNIS
tara:strand:+ start:8481 stop:8804 length:324 start_codon:yes stop_codon:yes gene_type:complete